MTRAGTPVSPRVKRLLLTATALFTATAALAADVDPKLEKAVRDSVPVCAGTTVSFDELPVKLPARFKGTLVRLDSKRASCTGQYAGVLSPTGGFYLGMPWVIENEDGATVEEKLKNFTWRNMQINIAPVIERKLNDDGLWPVTLQHLTEAGKLPMEGELDPSGKVFFFGHFRRLSGDLRAQRLKVFDSLMAKAPARGAADAPVTVVEFSDFECPSCKRAAGYADAVLAKHGEKVRYIRLDLPLTGHPWAFAAALAGRAIHRQKPELFWEYKKQVYANQENLNAFMIWDWARGWAQDHELDMTKYDADLANEAVRNEILRSAAVALSNDVRATPTYMVNGAMVDPGEDGTALVEYVGKLLAN